MFPSLSSCPLSTPVTTSFTAKTNQELVINQPVTVVGPNVYYLIADVLHGFEVKTDPNIVYSYNPTLHLIQGRTYRFDTDCVDESTYLTTTAGVEYSTGLRYTQYDRNRQQFIAPTYQSIVSAYYLTWPNIFTFGSTTSASQWSVMVVNWWGGVFPGTLLQPGVDYVASNPTGTTVQFDFTGRTTTTGQSARLYFITGAYTLTSFLKPENYRVTVNGSLRTLNTHYRVQSNVIRFHTSQPNGARIVVDYYGGMEGGFFFTPTSTTPTTLQYRSRTGNPKLLGTILISAAGTTYPANTQVKLKPGETASVTVTSPATHLAYQSYQYFLSSSPATKNYFAVVNKNNYQPLVKFADRVKRYYNYVNFASSFTLYDQVVDLVVYTSPPGLGIASSIGRVNMALCHVLLDVVKSKVNIYSKGGVLANSIVLPDFPIHYEKYTYITGGKSVTELLVLAADGKVYRIDNNLKVTNSNAFVPAVKTAGFIASNLPINEDIPFLGSFTDAARNSLTRSLFPVVTTMAVQGSTVYLAGDKSIAAVSLTGAIPTIIVSNSYGAMNGTILNISPWVGTGVIATTTTHRVYYLSGGYILLLSVPVVTYGAHCAMPRSGGSRVCIPDPHNRRLLVINSFISSGATTAEYIALGDFAPAYCKRVGDLVYVTGHDTNEVIKITTTNSLSPTITGNYELTRFYMPYKTTVVSVVDESIIAHHYLNNRTILNFAGTGIKKVIPKSFKYKEGPTSSIGTDPQEIYLLGETTVTPIPGPFMQYWVNGTIKGVLNDGQLLGINYRAQAPGVHQSFIILGEHAIDYTVKVYTDSSYLDHRNIGVNGVNLMPAVGPVFVAPVAAPGNYTLPFNINFFGTTYNEFWFNVTAGLTSGILVFNPAFNTPGIVPSFATATTDALLVEPRRIYIDYPIDNSVVAAVTHGTIAGGVVPGAYYSSGVIGEFQFYKWKYIGTNEFPLPNGFTQQTENVVQTGVEINMLNSAGIAVGDYVSNPIAGTPPYTAFLTPGPVVGLPGCLVTAVTPYTDTATGYHTEGTRIYVTLPVAPFKLYSKATSGAVTYGYSAQTGGNFFNVANACVKVDTANSTIILEGLTDLVTITAPKFIFEVTTTKVSTTYRRDVPPAVPFTTPVGAPVTTTTVDDLITAQSLTHSLATFYPIAALTGSDLVRVSLSTYNSLIIGQKLTSASFGAITETVIDKIIKVKSITLRLNRKIVGEGTNAIIEIFGNNINNGTTLNFEILPGLAPLPFAPATVDPPDSDFTGPWTFESPGGTIVHTEPTPTSTPISFPIFSNYAKITIGIAMDVDIPYEFFRIRVTGYDVVNPARQATIPANFTSTSFGVNPVIGTYGGGSSMTVNDSLPEYFIKVGAAYNTSPAVPIQGQTTKIKFVSLPATILQETVTNPITYSLPQLPPPAPPVTDPNDTVTVDVYTVTQVRYKYHYVDLLAPVAPTFSGYPAGVPLTFSGNYITLSVTQTLPNLTAMLFKTPVVHQPVQMELAFYIGRNFQYIEYNYRGAPGHDVTLPIGMRNASGSYQVQVAGTPGGIYSRLFGGNSADGVFYDLLNASFTHIPSGGFLPRFPRIFREDVYDKSTIRYDIYLDYKIPAIIDLRASVDYGYLKLNAAPYDGTRNLQENDILTVEIPFQTNKPTSAVVLSIGSGQYALPAGPEAIIKAKTETVTFVPFQPIITNLNTSFPIMVTGMYMIPDYFKSADGSGAEYVFERWVGGTLIATLNRGEYHNLVAGDTIVLNNIFTGYRNYNYIEILLAGPEILKYKLETVGKPANILNYINFGVLDEPFKLRRKEANVFLPTGPAILGPELLPINQLLPGAPFTEIFDGSSVPEYETLRFPLTIPAGTLGVPVDLFADGGNVSFVVNDVRFGSNSSLAVTGDTIGLEILTHNYAESNVNIWQVTVDPFDLSNIYTQVGEWRIRNKQLEPLLVNLPPGLGKSVANVVVLASGAGYNRNTISVQFSAPPSGETAEGFALLNTSNGITEIVITNAGYGYVSPPIITITGPGAGAVFSILLTDNVPAQNEIYVALGTKITNDTVSTVPGFEQKALSSGNYFTSLMQSNHAPQGTVVFIQGQYYKSPVENTWAFNQLGYKTFSSINYAFGSTAYVKENSITNLTGSLSYKPISYNLIYGEAKDSFLLKFDIAFRKLENTANVVTSATEASIKLPDYTIHYPPREILSKLSSEISNITTVFAPTAEPTREHPVTYFIDSNDFDFQAQTLLINLMPQSELVTAATILTANVSPYQNVYFITQISTPGSSPSLAQYSDLDGFKLTETPVAITSLLGDAADPDYYFINYLESAPIESKIVTIESVVGSVEGEDLFYGRIETPAPYSEGYFITSITGNVDKEELQYSVLDKNVITNEFVKQTTFFVGSLTNEQQQFNVLAGILTYKEFAITVVSSVITHKESGYTLFSKELTYQKPPSPVTMEWELSYQKPPSPVTFESELIYEFQGPSVREIDFPPLLTDPGNRYIDFPPELGDPGNRYIDFPPELGDYTILEKQLEVDHIFQDKVFLALDPEWIYQDKAFLELQPRYTDPPNRYIDFPPQLGDPGNRYIDFPPQLGDPGNRYIDFPPELDEPRNLYIDFPPELDEPRNLYIDFPAIWFEQDNPLINLTPELIGQDKSFIKMNFELFQLEVDYLKDASVYGAFKTEFKVYADDGRAGDFYQQKGILPGTFNRPRGPFIPYQQFMGSALVMNISTYGLGGFTTQANAQIVADKYVNASVIKVVLSDIWNYRIHFGRRVFTPRKSRIFPRIWYIRGG